MDFIERIFHVSPDHGSGILEAALVLVVFVAPIAVAMIRNLRRTHGVNGL